MIVKLINWTPNPLETVLFAYQMMKEKKVETDLKKFNTVERFRITRQLIKDNLNTPLEFVSTVWFFDEVTRAFQQQLTRHRHFGFSIQSLRVVSREEFANKGQYLVPDDVKDEMCYRGAMQSVQLFYNTLLERGESVQVARGILPLNIFSPISMVANMRGLLHMFEQRMCRQVQGEFKEVVKCMIEEIEQKMSPVFVDCLKEPCLMRGKCMMSTENELRAEGKDTLGRKPCPLYEAVRGK